MPKNMEEVLMQQRDEALLMLRKILENYKHNGRKGLGVGPVMQAKNLLDKYPHLERIE